MGIRQYPPSSVVRGPSQIAPQIGRGVLRPALEIERRDEFSVLVHQINESGVVVLPGSNEEEIDSSFAMLARRHIGALVVTADGFLISRQDQLVALAARHAIPTMYPLSQYVVAGGLMSYGANLPDAFLRPVPTQIAQAMRHEFPSNRLFQQYSQ